MLQYIQYICMYNCKLQTEDGDETLTLVLSAGRVWDVADKWVGSDVADRLSEEQLVLQQEMARAQSVKSTAAQTSLQK